MQSVHVEGIEAPTPPPPPPPEDPPGVVSYTLTAVDASGTGVALPIRISLGEVLVFVASQAPMSPTKEDGASIQTATGVGAFSHVWRQDTTTRRPTYAARGTNEAALRFVGGQVMSNADAELVNALNGGSKTLYVRFTMPLLGDATIIRAVATDGSPLFGIQVESGSVTIGYYTQGCQWTRSIPGGQSSIAAGDDVRVDVGQEDDAIDARLSRNGGAFATILDEPTGAYDPSQEIAGEIVYLAGPNATPLSTAPDRRVIVAAADEAFHSTAARDAFWSILDARAADTEVLDTVTAILTTTDGVPITTNLGETITLEGY